MKFVEDSSGKSGDQIRPDWRDERDHDDNDRDDPSHSCLERSAGAGQAEGYHVEVPFFILFLIFPGGDGEGWIGVVRARLLGHASAVDSPFLSIPSVLSLSSLHLIHARWREKNMRREFNQSINQPSLNNIYLPSTPCI